MKGEPAHTVGCDVLLSTHRPSSQVEKALGVEGDAILYVGDHIYTDAALAKLNFKWVRSLCCAVFCLLRRAVREWGTTYTITNAALAMLTFLPSSPLALRWRTALIIRELESEVDSLARGRPHRDQLKELMAKKVGGGGRRGGTLWGGTGRGKGARRLTPPSPRQRRRWCSALPNNLRLSSPPITTDPP